MAIRARGRSARYGSRRGIFLFLLPGLGSLIQPWLSADGVVQWVTSFPAAFVGIGFFMIIFIAALVGIPQDYYEAAAIDGANSWQQLIHVTLPAIRGVYVAAMILALQ